MGTQNMNTYIKTYFDTNKKNIIEKKVIEKKVIEKNVKKKKKKSWSIFS
jgi:hypothetical protein